MLNLSILEEAVTRAFLHYPLLASSATCQIVVGHNSRTGARPFQVMVGHRKGSQTMHACVLNTCRMLRGHYPPPKRLI